MSELLNTHANREDARWQLLSSVSAAALLSLICTVPQAKAGDTERPTVWIELGGQLEHLTRVQDVVSADFINSPASLPPTPFGSLGSPGGPLLPIDYPGPFSEVSPLSAQQPPKYSFGGEARLVFQPQGSDWKFAASLRYGRSNGDKEVQHTTRIANYLVEPHHGRIDQYPDLFSNAVARTEESHSILDFQVGRDVGLGLFGHGANSVVNFGVRFAQFASKFTSNLDAVPNIQVYSHHNGGIFKTGDGILAFIPINLYGFRFQTYAIRASSERSFHGIGPSLSWDGSTAIAGHPENAEMAFDWGVNAAVLFGRQKAKTSHETGAYDHYTFQGLPSGYVRAFTRYHDQGISVRNHTVIVPNLGGFAGMSLKFPSAKVSLGYRADFFFGAMDNGDDVRKTRTVGFYGPFAKISIGLGD